MTAQMSPSKSMGSPALPSHRTPSIDAVDRHDFGVQKNRRYPSTGGGRAWTEDEEVYLLQTRLQKMPYKHIAAHLKKTELACRLHYHQLSHGSNRRKRTASFSSIASSQSPLVNEQRLSPDAELSTAPTTPEQTSSEHPEAAVVWKVPSELPERSCAVSPLSHTPILPKPVNCLPCPVQRSNLGLRLDCNVAAVGPRPMVNQHRLREIYEAHRVSFWKMIAADYGEGVDPALLEDTWRKGFIQGPPTPDDTFEGSRFGPLMEERVILPALQPAAHLDRSFSPHNSRMSVSSAASSDPRSALKLPTPSTASTEGSMMSAASIPATAIAALLNDSRDYWRLPSLQSARRASGEDVMMTDAGR